MAFPTLQGTPQNSTSTSLLTSHTINTGTPANGQLLLLIVHFKSANQTITWPVGKTMTQVGRLPQSTNNEMVVFYRRCDGTEGATITMTTSATTRMVARSWRFTGHHASSAPEAAFFVYGAVATPNPPNLAPSWGAEDNQWLTTFGNNNGTETVSIFPTNYINTGTVTTGASTGVTLGYGTRQLNAASEDPGTFTKSSTSNGVASTIAIRPAAVGGTTHQGSATIAGTSTLAAVGLRSQRGAAAIAGVGTLTGAARRTQRGSVGIAGQGSLAGVARIVVRGQAALSGSSAVVPAGRLVARSQAQVGGAGSLSANGVRVQRGSVVIAGISDVAALARLVARGVVLIEGTSTLTGTASSPGGIVHQGSVVIAGTSSVQAVGRRVALGSAQIMGTSSLIVSGGDVAPLPAGITFVVMGRPGLREARAENRAFETARQREFIAGD